MPQVFISHSTKDQEFVERTLLPALRAHGVIPWYSKRDIHTGHEWIASIEEGLKASEWFLVVLSATSAESKWVKRELNWAIMERESRIIPVVVEHCPQWDAHFVLAQIQHADFTKDRESALANVLSRIGPVREATEAPGGVVTDEKRPKHESQAPEHRMAQETAPIKIAKPTPPKMGESRPEEQAGPRAGGVPQKSSFWVEDGLSRGDHLLAWGGLIVAVGFMALGCYYNNIFVFLASFLGLGFSAIGYRNRIRKNIIKEINRRK
jgi:hypothetical protein